MNTKDNRSSRLPAGALHLARLSTLRNRIQTEAPTASILIVEDDAVDARFLETQLARLFGDRAHFVVVPTLRQMSEQIDLNDHDIILLDDRLAGRASAEDGLARIRARRPDAVITVVSRLVTRQRSFELKQQGAYAVIAKEDLDSASLGELVLEAIARRRRRA